MSQLLSLLLVGLRMAAGLYGTARDWHSDVDLAPLSLAFVIPVLSPSALSIGLETALRSSREDLWRFIFELIGWWDSGEGDPRLPLRFLLQTNGSRLISTFLINVFSNSFDSNLSTNSARRVFSRS